MGAKVLQLMEAMTVYCMVQPCDLKSSIFDPYEKAGGSIIDCGNKTLAVMLIARISAPSMYALMGGDCVAPASAWKTNLIDFRYNL